VYIECTAVVRFDKNKDSCSRKQPVWLLYTLFAFCAGALLFALLFTAFKKEQMNNRIITSEKEKVIENRKIK